MFASRSFLFLAELRPEMLDARAGMQVGRYTDRFADSTDKEEALYICQYVSSFPGRVTAGNASR